MGILYAGSCHIRGTILLKCTRTRTSAETVGEVYLCIFLVYSCFMFTFGVSGYNTFFSFIAFLSCLYVCLIYILFLWLVDHVESGQQEAVFSILAHAVFTCFNLTCAYIDRLAFTWITSCSPSNCYPMHSVHLTCHASFH